MMPSTQLGFAVRILLQGGCEKQRHSYSTQTHTVYTYKQSHKSTHSVYSHKREHGHNSCGDEQLRCQNQIHLKKHTDVTAPESELSSSVHLQTALVPVCFSRLTIH